MKFEKVVKFYELFHRHSPIFLIIPALTGYDLTRLQTAPLSLQLVVMIQQTCILTEISKCFNPCMLVNILLLHIKPLLLY